MRKRIIALLMALVLAVGLLPAPAWAADEPSFSGGSGAQSDPYRIASAADLVALANAVNSGISYDGQFLELTQNLDLSGENRTPIGNSDNCFKGTFDGNFHTIYNLTVNTTSRYCGLFGRAQGATIENLGIENASINSTNDDAAILLGNDLGGTTIRICYVTGAVTAGGAAGGLVSSTHGSSNPTIISNCYARVALTHTGSTADVSGIASWNYSGSVKVTNCFSACIGEVRPIVGWSDGSAVNSQNVVGTFFDKTLSPDFQKTGFTDLGKTSDELKDQSTYEDWDFDSTWAIDAGKNGGYPYLQGFTPGLGGAPGSVSVTVTDSDNKPVTDAEVTIRNGETETALSQERDGVYSGVVTTTGAEYEIYVNGTNVGTVSQTGSNAANTAVTVPSGGSDPGPHSHKVCIGADEGAHDCTHEAVTWTAWDGTGDSLAPGSYYLTQDVTLDAPLEIGSGEISLCLNGHKLSAGTKSANHGVIDISDGGTLNLCDCDSEGSGTISSGRTGIYVLAGTANVYGGTITDNIVQGIKLFDNTAIANVYGGTISGNNYGINVSAGTANVHGGTITKSRYVGINAESTGTANVDGGEIRENEANGINVGINGKANISGGKISGNEGCGVYVSSSTSAVTLSGAPDISGNEGGNLRLLEGSTVTIDGGLTEGVDIGVSVAPEPGEETPAVDITGPYDVDYSGFFHSDDGDYEIKSTTDGDGKFVVQLVVKPHSHPVCGAECGDGEHAAVTWTAWDGSGELADGGSYYLAQDVTLSDTLEINGNISLCLNGHKLSAGAAVAVSEESPGGNMIYISGSGTLNLCDCDNDGKGTISGGGWGIGVDGSNATANVYGGTITETANDGIYVESGGTANVYGGTISGNEGDGINVAEGSAANISGGTISGNGNYGVYVADSDDSSAKVTLSGAPVIKDNKSNNKDGNLYLPIGSTVTIGDGGLKDGAYIGVTVDPVPDEETPAVDITGPYDVDYSGFFHSDDGDYEIKSTTDGDGKFVVQLVKPHTHAWSEDWTTSDTHHWHVCTADDCDITDYAACGEDDAEYAAHTKTWVSTDAAQHWQTCATCGWKGTKTDHNWGSGEVTTPPTGGEAGVRTYTCSVCEATRTEPIPALGYTVSGTVKDENDDPVSGATVTLKKEDAQVGEPVTTDADGKYEFTGLPSGTYTIEISKGDLTGTTEVTVTDSDTTVPDQTITPPAPDTYTVSGTVKDETGEPVPGATVKLKKEDGTLVATVETGSDGTYTFDDVEPGTYVIEIGKGDLTGSADVTVSDSDTAVPDQTITPPAAHSHAWATAWTTSATGHWHACEGTGTCDITADSGKDGYGAHVYDDDADTSCNTCGYTRTVEPAGGHSHAMSVSCETSGDELLAFTPLSSASGELAAGNYYLAADISLERPAPDDKALTIAGTVNLCLNGHTLSTTKAIHLITVKPGGTLNLCDCHTTGQIKKDGNDQYIIKVEEGGAFNFYGGTLGRSETDNAGRGLSNEGTATIYGGRILGNNYRSMGIMNADNGVLTMLGGEISGNLIGIYVSGGTVTISGGKITGNKQTGVEIDYAKKVTLSGAPVINNNSNPLFTTSNLHIAGDSFTVTIGEGGLTEGADIGVWAGRENDSTPRSITGQNDRDYSAYFHPDDSKCEIKNGAGNVVQLVVKAAPAHTHAWATAWTTSGTHHWHECAAAGCDITADADKDGYAAHTPGDWIVDQAATAEAAGSKHKECGVCGYTTETATIPKLEPAEHTHAWATDWESNSTHHWHECTADGCTVTADADKDGYAAHTPGDWIIDQAATTEAAGSKHKACGVCGYTTETATIPKLEPGHTHVWATAWESNSTHHWHECAAAGCDITADADKDGYGVHTPGDWIVDQAATAEAAGSKHKECGVCGYTTETGTIPKLEPGHTHAWATAWESNSTHHWHECTADGCNITADSDKNGYGEHSWNDGVVTTPPTGSGEGVRTYTCSVCAATRTEPIPALGFDISGQVTDSENMAVAGAKVTLKLGRTEVAGTVTDARGNYSFSGVAPGSYNVVAEQANSDGGTKTMTILVIVTDANQSEQNLKMPSDNVNSVLDVKNSTVENAAVQVDKTVVGGLEAEAQAQADADETATGEGESKTVTVEMSVEAKTEADNASDIKDVAGSGKKLDYLEITVVKKVETKKGENSSTTESAISTTTNLLTIVIPFNFSGKSGITVYRYHGSAEAMAENPSGGSEGYRLDVANGLITIYAKNFSTYAIGYTESTGTCTVTFDSTGGTDVASQTCGLNAKVEKPEDPTRNGYTFDGWYRDEGCTTKWSFADDTVTGDITLYAKWKENSAAPVTPPAAGDGGSGGRPTGYPVDVPAGVPNGSVSASPANAGSGDTVTITATPDEGYVTGSVTVTGKDGESVPVTDRGGGKYTFTMPAGKATVSVSFVKAGEGYSACPKDDTCPIRPYTDASVTAWYHDGVHYCIENGLMSGYSAASFAPGDSTSRAMIATILWRLEGRAAVNYILPFDDVADGMWYTEAIRWAAANGVVNGYGDGKFGPGDPITREQLAAMLYRYEQYKGGGFTGAWAFRLDYADAGDVSDWAYEPMCWTTMNGIVNGVGDKRLDPGGSATRAQAATMIMRYRERS